MTLEKTGIEGAFVLHPKVFGDERGFFLEIWNQAAFSKLGIDATFVQDNHSRSTRGVLRGLHYQIGDDAQGKLVWASRGAVFDVFVDLRVNSPTFGQWHGHVLDDTNHDRLWIPPGCAHGFYVLSDIADFQYKCSAPYAPPSERTLCWNDPDIGINWPIHPGETPIISAKDLAGVAFADCERYTNL